MWFIDSDKARQSALPTRHVIVSAVKQLSQLPPPPPLLVLPRPAPITMDDQLCFKYGQSGKETLKQQACFCHLFLRTSALLFAGYFSVLVGLIPFSHFILIIKTLLVYYDYRDFSTDTIVCCISPSLATTLFCRVLICHLYLLRLTDLCSILFCFISGSFNTLSHSFPCFLHDLTVLLWSSKLIS